MVYQKISLINQHIEHGITNKEQHIRRERATSNICTAQSLLAIINSFFAVYHGPEGLKDIALTIKAKTDFTINKLKANGFKVTSSNSFDTLSIVGDDLTHFNEKALSKNTSGILIRVNNPKLEPNN